MRLFLLAVASQQDPIWVYPVVLGGLALIIFLLWLLNRLFPSTKSSHASVGNALMRVKANFLPGREHIVGRANVTASKKTMKGSHQRPGVLNRAGATSRSGPICAAIKSDRGRAHGTSVFRKEHQT